MKKEMTLFHHADAQGLKDGFIAIALIDGEAHSTIEHFQNVQNVVFSISLWRQGETLVIIDGGEYVFHCFYSETHSLSSF
mmetsp:Transcript_38283/g.50456  ORF Transcript_38283/g.50456 Transcript_38283/m.50456 type:complete len:80 (-) Transcript_38283:959-1198(-)